MLRIKKLFKKKDKIKNKNLGLLETITILIILACIFLYEVCFCNLKDIIVNRSYNFSLFRVVMYVIFGVCYYKFSGEFIEEAKKTLEKKKKIIYAYLGAVVFYTIYTFIKQTQYYVIVLILMAELNGLLFLLYVTKDYIKNIIISILTFGFVFSISNDVYHCIDEKKHFVSTFNVAFFNFDFNNAIIDDELNKIDYDLPTANFAMEYYSKKYIPNISKISDEETIYSTPANYCPLLYIPGSIGINVARFLGGSIADVFFAGRMTNVIFYALLLIIMFKILPFKKDLFYALYLLPLVIVISASYSIDGMVIGGVGIFIAYLFKEYKECKDKNKSIDFKTFIKLILLFSISLICKSGAYLSIIILFMFFPLLKLIKENKKIRYLVLGISLITFFILITQTIKIITPNVGDSRSDGSGPSGQIEFLLENKFSIFEVYKNFLKSTVFNLKLYNNFNLRVLFGKNYTFCGYLLFIYVIYITLFDNTYYFNKKEKIILSLTFIMTFFITTFIIYISFTPVGHFNIKGYQARYLIPVLPLFLSCFNSKNVQKNDESETYNVSTIIFGGITLIDLILLICQ